MRVCVFVRCCVLTRCVSPGLVIGRKHSQVAAADKVFVVHGQQWAGRGEELGVEDDLQGSQGHTHTETLSQIKRQSLFKNRHTFKGMQMNLYAHFIFIINTYAYVSLTMQIWPTWEFPDIHLHE